MYKTMVEKCNLAPEGYAFTPDAGHPACRKVLKQIAENNVYFPRISNIIFNLKTEDNLPVLDAEGKKVMETYTAKNGEARSRVKRTMTKLDHPVLTTIVYFDDNSKSVVVNSSKDKLALVERVVNQEEIDLAKKLGKPEVAPITVLDADDSSKENGIVYAIFKRVYGIPSPETKVEGNKRITEGTVANSGTSHIIRDMVNSAFNTTLEAAYRNTDARVNTLLAEQRKSEAAARKAETDAALKNSQIEYSKNQIRGFLEALNSEDLKTLISELKAKFA